MNPQNRLLLMIASISSLCSHAWATENVSIDPAKIAHLLGSPHAVPWSTLATDEDSRVLIRNTLLEFAQDPDALSKYISKPTRAPKLRRNALEELGKFSVDPSGQMDETVFTLLRKAIQSPGSVTGEPADRTSALNALKNANTPEAARYILELAQDSGTSNLAYSAYSRLSHMLNPAFVNRPPMEMEADLPYSPHLGLPLAQRAKAKEWEELVKDLEPHIKKQLSSRGLATDFREVLAEVAQSGRLLLSTDTQQAAAPSQAGNSRSTSDSPGNGGVASAWIASAAAAEVDRGPALEPLDDSSSADSMPVWLATWAAVIGALAYAYRGKRRQSK